MQTYTKGRSRERERERERKKKKKLEQQLSFLCTKVLSHCHLAKEEKLSVP